MLVKLHVWWPYSKAEGVGMLSQLLYEPLLQAAQRLLLVLQGRESLDRADVKILPERKAQDIQVLPTITKCTGQGHKHWGWMNTLIKGNLLIWSLNQWVCYFVSIFIFSYLFDLSDTLGLQGALHLDTHTDTHTLRLDVDIATSVGFMIPKIYIMSSL